MSLKKWAIPTRSIPIWPGPLFSHPEGIEEGKQASHLCHMGQQGCRCPGHMWWDTAPDNLERSACKYKASVEWSLHASTG